MVLRNLQYHLLVAAVIQMSILKLLISPSPRWYLLRSVGKGSWFNAVLIRQNLFWLYDRCQLPVRYQFQTRAGERPERHSYRY